MPSKMGFEARLTGTAGSIKKDRLLLGDLSKRLSLAEAMVRETVALGMETQMAQLKVAVAKAATASLWTNK